MLGRIPIPPIHHPSRPIRPETHNPIPPQNGNKIMQGRCISLSSPLHPLFKHSNCTTELQNAASNTSIHIDHYQEISMPITKSWTAQPTQFHDSNAIPQSLASIAGLFGFFMPHLFPSAQCAIPFLSNDDMNPPVCLTDSNAQLLMLLSYT